MRPGRRLPQFALLVFLSGAPFLRASPEIVSELRVQYQQIQAIPDAQERSARLTTLLATWKPVAAASDDSLWIDYWLIRAAAALELDSEHHGRVAGHHLHRLDAIEKASLLGMPLISRVHQRDWLRPYFASITIDSDPAGANVVRHDGGTVLGPPPYRADNFPGNRTYNLTIEKAGYLPQSLTWEAKSGKLDAFSRKLAAASTIIPGHSFEIDDLGLKMIWVEPGSVESTTWESYDHFAKRRYKRTGKRQVVISQGYFLAATELTNQQWRVLMGNKPAKDPARDPWPVAEVTWEQARQFCRQLTARDQASGALPAGWSYTLPTRDQWEFAARAGSTTDYPDGNGKSDLDRVAWYYGNFTTPPVGGPRPVALKAPNSWGFYDMLGNVSEWRLDSPPHLASYAYQVGGSFWSEAECCRPGLHDYGSKTLASRFTGFRPTLVGPVSSSAPPSAP